MADDKIGEVSPESTLKKMMTQKPTKTKAIEIQN